MFLESSLDLLKSTFPCEIANQNLFQNFAISSWITSLRDSITGSLTFSEKKPSHHALPTNPTRSEKPSPRLPRSANLLETNAPFLTANYAYEEMKSSRCNTQYIGSTTRFIHDRAREHINKENSSVKKNTSIPARTKATKALRSRLLWAKTTPLIYASMKHFTLSWIIECAQRIVFFFLCENCFIHAR